MTIFLHGMALANFKGYGPDINFIGPFDRFNFFIGANNSGKSSVLELMVKHLNRVMTEQVTYSQPKIDFLPIERNTLNAQNAPLVCMGFPRAKFVNDLRDKYRDKWEFHDNIDIVESILESYAEFGLIWLIRDEKGALRAPTTLMEPSETTVYKNSTLSGAQRVRAVLQNHNGGSNSAIGVLNDIKQSLFLSISTRLPSISLIPAIREVSLKGASFDDWSGRGLIEELMKHQSPDFGEQEKARKFEAINDFIKSVTNNNSAKIKIPHSLQHILVEMDGKELPLSSLGTGIHEVIILAASCTLMTNQIVCVEEPEIHLHPLLQKRLIQYLEKHTNNQYFIATHSASILDAVGAAIFHTTSHDKYAWIKPALNSSTRSSICQDLGYKASDVLQSNCVVWVEGPSDRIYINWWIKSLAPDLREGIHYSIMFYGGRLLSHLSGEEDESEVAALIELKRLNRNCCVVIDSDKSSAADDINDTKARIVREFSQGRGMTWISYGREIENYLDPKLITEALTARYPKYLRRLKQGTFDNVLPFRRSDGVKQQEVDKVAIAKHIARGIPNLNIHDLKSKLDELISLIKTSN